MYFLMSFMVLLRQLRRLYASGPIFQVPPVYNYSTCCTNRVRTRSYVFTRLVYPSLTRLVHS